MQRFAALYLDLDATTKTNAKVAAMVDYFRATPDADAAWAVFFLTGQRLKRFIPSARLRRWAGALTGVPEWLLADCHAATGDTAETTALILDSWRAVDRPPTDLPLHRWMDERVLPLRDAAEDAQREAMHRYWQDLDRRGRFMLNKLLIGGLRVGVSRTLVTRALAQVAGTDQATMSHRLMGDWRPSAEAYRRLLSEASRGENLSRPYPFFLASSLEADPAALGAIAEWQAEWKWDGIRGQIIKRGGELFVWSRGGDLVTERFPEITASASHLPEGTVLDGEILAWNADGVLPFAVLQQRIGRDKLSPAILSKAPVRFLAYDLLERAGQDVRAEPLTARRAGLEQVIAALGTALMLSPVEPASSWAQLAALRDRARERLTEGLMLKRLASAYQVGRRRGDWWKWKIDPLTIDAVLVYAQAGSGRRANLYTDYGFAVWRDDELVPIAKAYSGLDDGEIAELDRWIRRNTRDRFGPVRQVTPQHVFELAFEGIQRSNRHKSGVALRFPRIARWRRDKTAPQADTIDAVHALLNAG